MQTGRTTIVAGLYDGRPFNSPNDITIDRRGRIYFSDPRYLGHEPVDQPVEKSERLAGVCSLNPAPSPKGDRVDVSWKSGGLTFDFEGLLESCLKHIDTTHEAMGAPS